MSLLPPKVTNTGGDRLAGEACTLAQTVRRQEDPECQSGDMMRQWLKKNKQTTDKRQPGPKFNTPVQRKSTEFIDSQPEEPLERGEHRPWEASA